MISLNELEIHRKIMRPIRSRPYISIAIPSSLTTDGKTLREQTTKIGYIGRAAAIFRVEEILIYSDGEGNTELIRSILSYLEIPPYLKKVLASLSPELRFVGIIPPLKTPHHLPPDVFDTAYRDGVVIDRYEDRCVIDIGLDMKGVIYGSCPPKGARITIKIVGKGRRYYNVKIVNRDSVDIYWGYTLHTFNSMYSMLNYARTQNYMIIAASKKGAPIHNVEDDIIKGFSNKNAILIVFGGPYLDVDEIAYRENMELKNYFEYVINFVPRQGTVNIRTEEAIIATLSIMNYIKEKYAKIETESRNTT